MAVLGLFVLTAFVENKDMNNKLWAGRFSKELSSVADDFNSSIRFDSRMYIQDIRGSIAHATMLGMQGIITVDEAHTIINELVKIEEDITEGRLEIDMSAEDVHMFVESVLTERIGDTGKKLHTARSRNDQVAVDIRLWLKDETDEIISNICSLIEALTNKADEYNIIYIEENCTDGRLSELLQAHFGISFE